ncbi:S26 family signal peptidase [Catellatospora sp. KI3]|uniref:S26 family signal peptidase n=1 Tax=Catellatospora sp. KI3 TaxID=3041620 RepID=UPI002482954F|nr:S26 family signal peptidase [Catellatospora sp. KI3]MDI1461427.1 S26 family signal peptidase [Catellatospora sp. KI3]
MIALSAVALVLLPLLAAWYARARLIAVTVEGTSMEPTYAEGDRVLVRRVRPGRVRRGDVVVLDNPFGRGTVSQWVIKRAAALPGDPVPRAEYPALAGVAEQRIPARRIVLRADNPHGGDSRTLGWVDSATVVGIVMGRLPRGGR